MAFENRFPYPNSPSAECFSGRSVPCHWEAPSLPSDQFDKANDGKSAIQDECPYRSFCQATAPGLENLFVIYGKSIAVTLTEQSSSISVRSEHRFGGEDRFRQTLRKHLFEILPGCEVPQQRFRMSPESVAGLIRFAEVKGLTLPATAAIERLVTNWNVSDAFLSKDQFNAKLDELFNNHDISSGEAGQLRPLFERFASSSLYCHRITPKDGRMFGEYMGFVDIRANYAPSSLALAILKPPQRLRNRSDVRLLAGDYSSLFGGPAFRGSIFSAQEGEQGGVICADACLVMALGMLSDRIPTLEGGFDLAYLAALTNREKLLEQPTAYSSDCLGKSDNLDGSFKIDGLTGVQMARLGDSLSKELAASRGYRTIRNDVAIAASLLNRKGFGPYANDPAFEQEDAWLLRIIEANLIARFPMILNVDSDAWTCVRTGKPRERPLNLGHAVVIVGLSGNLARPSTANLIVHDPGVGPFVEVPFGSGLSAARALKLKDSEKAAGIVSMVTFFPRAWIPAELALHVLQYRSQGSPNRVIQFHLEKLASQGRIDLVYPNYGRSICQTSALGRVEPSLDEELAGWFKRRTRPHWRFLAASNSGTLSAAFVQADRSASFCGPAPIGRLVS